MCVRSVGSGDVTALHWKPRLGSQPNLQVDAHQQILTYYSIYKNNKQKYQIILSQWLYLHPEWLVELWHLIYVCCFLTLQESASCVDAIAKMENESTPTHMYDEYLAVAYLAKEYELYYNIVNGNA